MSVIEGAAIFAASRHLGQRRKGKDVPYVVHPARVAAALETHYPDDPELAAAGMLHDTIEDTATTRRELADLFGQRIADLVHAVTNRPSFVPTKNKDVLRLKAADLYDNISETLRDVRDDSDVWDRFAAGSGKVLRWRYYTDKIMAVIGDEPIAQRLDDKLRQVEAIAPVPPESYATRAALWDEQEAARARKAAKRKNGKK